jgi:hypothetical protein
LYPTVCKIKNQQTVYAQEDNLTVKNKLTNVYRTLLERFKEQRKAVCPTTGAVRKKCQSNDNTITTHVNNTGPDRCMA